jgi:hypothetical protein
VEVLLHAFLALAKGKSGEVHDLAAIPWWFNSWYPLNRRLDGTQQLSLCYEEVKEHLPLLGIEHKFPGCPYSSLITIQTELFQLHINMKTHTHMRAHCKSHFMFLSLRVFPSFYFHFHRSQDFLHWKIFLCLVYISITSQRDFKWGINCVYNIHIWIC